jgi:hypothetical protein
MPCCKGNRLAIKLSSVLRFAFLTYILQRVWLRQWYILRSLYLPRIDQYNFDHQISEDEEQARGKAHSFVFALALS